MKAPILMVMAIVITNALSAQTYTLNWGSSFSPAWSDMATSGTANNIGGSGINCSVTMNRSGGIFTNVYGSYGGPATPTVHSSTFLIPGSSNNIQISLDYSNASQYTDITFTFNTLVYNLNFYIGDIDRLTNTSNSYFDRIRVIGYNGVSNVNPKLSKYDNSNPTFLQITGNTARVNSNSGAAGNTYTDASDQRGTIKVDFQSDAIVSFTIRYDNAPGAAADPGVQNIGIGNIYFLRIPALPVELLSFEGKSFQGRNELNWQVANETEMDHYAIERSENGNEFKMIDKIQAKNFESNTYRFTDLLPLNHSYYRLKMVNKDGSASYSRIIKLETDKNPLIKVFPTLASNTLHIQWQSAVQENINCDILDLSGRSVYRKQFKSIKGSNGNIIHLPDGLPSGTYILRIGELGTIRFIKT